MNKTTNKYTPEVRERAVRMDLNGEGQHERADSTGRRNTFSYISIGADEWGRKEIIGLADGYRESIQSWRELLLDL